MNSSNTKSILAVLLVSLLIVSPVFAAGLSGTSTQSTEELLPTYLSPFYENDYSHYTVYDGSGNDITSVFYSETQSLYVAQNWIGIKAKYTQLGVASIEKSYEVVSSHILPRSTDLAKTVNGAVYQFMECTEGNGMTREVIVDMRGTYYYNPNTFVISQVSKPIVTNITISGGPADHTTPVLTGAKVGSYTARFRCVFNVSATLTYQGTTIGTYSFGTYNGSFDDTVQ